MKIAILNAHLPNYNALAQLTTWKNRREYCQRYGYHLQVKTDGWKMPAVHPVTWDRLKLMRDMVQSGKWDWVYCCGTDTYHTNMTIPLESLIDDAFHVIASPDWCAPIQADSFLVRNSKEGLGWLNMLLGLYEKYKNHVWVENQAMVDTLEANKAIIKILPQRRLNAYHYPVFWTMYPGEKKVKDGIDYFGNDGQWKPGDFLIHWPSIPLARRIDLCHVYEKFVVR